MESKSCQDQDMIGPERRRLFIISELEISKFSIL